MWNAAVFQPLKCRNTHSLAFYLINLTFLTKDSEFLPKSAIETPKTQKFWVNPSESTGASVPQTPVFFPSKTLVLWHLKKSFWVSRLGGTLLPVGRKKVLTPPDTPESRPSVKHGIGVLYAKRTCAIPAAVSVSEWWRILLPPCAPSLRALFARQSYRPIHVPTSPRHQWSVAACRITAVTRIGAAAAGFRAQPFKDPSITTNRSVAPCRPHSSQNPTHFPSAEHST